jgi:hypothetical protein
VGPSSSESSSNLGPPCRRPPFHRETVTAWQLRFNLGLAWACYISVTSGPCQGLSLAKAAGSYSSRLIQVRAMQRCLLSQSALASLLKALYFSNLTHLENRPLRFATYRDLLELRNKICTVVQQQ